MRQRQQMTGRLIIKLLIFCLILSVIGPSLSYIRSINPSFLPPEREGFRTDGWVQDGARLTLPKLAADLNRVKLYVRRGVMPGTHPDVKVSIESGAEATTDFVAVSTESSVSVPLLGACDPCSLTVSAPAGYSPGEAGRPLAFSLRKAVVKSKLNFPILKLRYYVTAALIIIIGAAALLLLYRVTPWLGMLFITPLASVYATAEMTSVSALWSVPFSLALLAIYIGLKRELSTEPTLIRPNSRRYILPLICIALVGLFLRIQGITFGLPGNHFHPDEEVKSKVIIGMFERDSFNPKYFNHPSFLLYATTFSYAIGKRLGVLPDWALDDQIIISGRMVSALAGTLSVIILYFIAIRFMSGKAALLVALLLAVVPIHVSISRYVKEDCLLTLWILCCVLSSLRFGEKPTLARALSAGVMAGLAFTTKYTGILAFPLIAIGLWIAWKKVNLSRIAASISLYSVSCAATFFLFSPFIILNYREFRRDLAMESHQVASGGHIGAFDSWGHWWSHALGTSLLGGITLPLLFICLIGIGVAIRKGPPLCWMIPLLFLYFYIPAEYVPGKNARYVLPCLPFLLLGAGLVVDSARSKKLALLVSSISVLLPLSKTLFLNFNIHPDNRERMVEWMTQNLSDRPSVLVPFKAYGAILPEVNFRTISPKNGASRFASLSEAELKQKGVQYILLSSFLYGPIYAHGEADAAHRLIFNQLFRTREVVHIIPDQGRGYLYHNPTTVLLGQRGEGDRVKREVLLASLEPARDLTRFSIW